MGGRIGILTGGGDAPGLNAVIRAATRTLLRRGRRVFGIQDGFEGLLLRRGRELGHDDVAGILARGGTILGTANRGQVLSRVEEAVENARRWELDGVIAIGGDGTLRISHTMQKAGLRVVAVPKTIDNDVPATDVTFGFDTAVTVAARAVEDLHSTADAHGRIMVVEVMGRTAGWIALYAGVAGGADVILLPEIGVDLQAVARCIKDRHRRRRYTIVVVAEGVGNGILLGKDLERLTGIEARATVLGHLQRAGSPTPADRLLGTRYGRAAAELAAKGGWGRLVALRRGVLTSGPISGVAGRTRRVPRNHELLRVARDVGTFLGIE